MKTLALWLDFLVIADHTENLGLAPAIAESNPVLLKNPWGREQHDLVKKGGFDNIARAAYWQDPAFDLAILLRGFA